MPAKTLSLAPPSAAAPFLVPLGLAIAVPLAFWLAAVGNVLDYILHPTPPGQISYVFAKLAGMMAVAFLATQIFLVVGKRLRLLDRRVAWSMRQHSVFGTVTLLLILVHVACFVTAASLRGGHVAADLLVPKLFDGAYDRGVGLGVVGFWLILTGVTMGPLLQRRLKNGKLRAIHQLSLMTLALALLHALMIGSEKGFILIVAVGVALGAVALAWRAVAIKGRTRVA